MFYDFGLRIGFVHVPRTGGVAITTAAKHLIGKGGGFDLGAFRHLPIRRMRKIAEKSGVPPTSMRWFAVYRPLDEIKESFARLVARDKELLESGFDEFTPSWVEVLHAADPVAEAWRRAMWPDEETDWWQFWVDDGDDVTLLPFSRLQEALTEYCDNIGVPRILLPSEIIN